MPGDNENGAKQIDLASENGEKAAPEPASIATDQIDSNAKDSSISTACDKNNDEKKMSKNQLKKKRKWEKAMEVKRRRKEQQKKIKIAKAKAEGRDVEAEKEDMERRRKDGSGWARRNEFWQEMFRKQSSKYQIYLDCSFEQAMSKSEINSLASQIRYCYASNKRAKHPVKTTACSLGGKTLDILNNVSGLDQWEHRAFYRTDKDIIETTEDKSKIVYLTSDSPNTLGDLEDDKIYIIGGIVDRNRLKRIAIDKAEKLGVKTAKLPIGDYLNMVSTKVLTCNHVFDILLKWRDNNGDWKKALLDVLPKKKEASEKAS
jgi:tRNA (guanine9-N1)-methyltransferase